MACTAFLLRLLMLLLLSSSSNLVCLNAIPITRITRSLQHKFDGFQVSQEISMEGVEGFNRGRMDLELDDYPGSGANNRHTPRPPFGRGCSDSC